LGIVTGASLGQVASQTLANPYFKTMSVNFPIHRPLLGFDKEEIGAIARKIKNLQCFFGVSLLRLSLQVGESCDSR